MTASCAQCWMRENQPPADPDQLHRYKMAAEAMFRAEFWDDQTPYEAHREAWAQDGDPAELERMLRHVD